MYFRIDFDGSKGEHKAVFAECSPTGAILQQFALTLDAPDSDLELVRLSTLAGLDGKPFSQIDPSLGWKKIKPEDYEMAVETKRRIFWRDEQLKRQSPQRCARCGGSGFLVSRKLPCPDCTSGELRTESNA